MTTGANNVAIGFVAGSSVTTGGKNVLMGRSAGDNITTSDGNTCLGYAAGDDITTGNHNTVIGNLCDVGGGGSAYRIVMGYSASGGSNDSLLIGRGTTDSQIAFGATSITAPSDIRLKEDIQDEEVGLDFINELRPVTFPMEKKAKTYQQI